jgi:hypothetical protein
MTSDNEKLIRLGLFCLFLGVNLKLLVAKRGSDLSEWEVALHNSNRNQPASRQ